VRQITTCSSTLVARVLVKRYNGHMTERQIQILAAIIEQYAEVAAPVGSVMLAKLFNVSSATIRSEMAKLEELGLIAQPHTSAGRIPTDQGYRFYVNAINEAQVNQVPVLDRSTRAIEARVGGHGDRADRAIRSAVDSLVELTHNLGIATIGDELYMNGIGNLFSQPEFMHGDHTQAVARLLDNLEPWLREAAPNEPLNVYIGSENPIGKSSGATLIISRFRSPYSDNSYIGVLGPTRQSYGKVMQLVRHAGAMLEEVL
jgi:heat-inducible transcriptional repressor